MARVRHACGCFRASERSLLRIVTRPSRKRSAPLRAATSVATSGCEQREALADVDLKPERRRVTSPTLSPERHTASTLTLLLARTRRRLSGFTPRLPARSRAPRGAFWRGRMLARWRTNSTRAEARGDARAPVNHRALSRRRAGAARGGYARERLCRNYFTPTPMTN